MRIEEMPINKHVPVSIVLHSCTREACASKFLCVCPGVDSLGQWGCHNTELFQKPVASVCLSTSQNARLRFPKHWH